MQTAKSLTYNQHNQCAPFGRRTGLTAGRCCGRYEAGDTTSLSAVMNVWAQ
jgi:hypothetical protein